MLEGVRCLRDRCNWFQVYRRETRTSQNSGREIGGMATVAGGLCSRRRGQWMTHAVILQQQ